MYASNKTNLLVVCGLLIIALILLCYLLVKSQTEKENFISNELSRRSYNQSKKLAFCFMIYDKIANPQLWETFFKNVDKSKYQIYIHFKETKPLGWFEQFKIQDSIETCWGCYSLVEAQLILAKHSLADPHISHCIWLSGSCVPVKSFDYVYDFLDQSKSYFNKSPDTQVFPRCNSLVKKINKSNIKKAAMQSVLNRSHTQLLVDNSQFIKDNFSQIKIPDEIAFITTLYHFGKQDELVLTNNQTFGATTYTCWSDMTNHKDFSASKKKGQPYNFSFICEDELKAVVKSNSLFARKFKDGCGGLDKLNTYIK